MIEEIPDSMEYGGFEYWLRFICKNKDEASIEAMRFRAKSDSTRKILARVKRIDTGSDVEVWAVYTRERSVEK